MKYIAILLLIAAHAFAATVQGVIFDDETQNPIARTHVTLTPLPGSSHRPASLLADDHGQYIFQSVQPGWYLIRASRIGFETAEYGQTHAGLPGVPFEVTEQNSANGELHQIVMRRQAAIVGSVVDDNAIGIPGWSVSVYTAHPPIRRITQGLTDDRGNFRIGELEPGAYIVRSGSGGLEDSSTIVPSYYKYGTAVAAAEVVHLRVGETQAFVIVHTVEGSLFELSGDVTAPDNRPVRLTLITDTGRRLLSNAAGPFVATGVPPGMVELLAEGAGCAGYQTINVDRNMFARVDCVPLSPPVINGGLSYPVLARRVDLDGPGAEVTASADQPFNPGNWEFTMRPGPSHYLVSVRNEGDSTPRPASVDGWFPVTIGIAPHLQVTLSAKAASISGIVSSAARPVTGAPVFLDLVNPDAPELSQQAWTGRADPQGHFTFSGLGPGTYRLLSSFEVDHDDPVATGKAVTLTLQEGDAASQPLELIQQ